MGPNSYWDSGSPFAPRVSHAHLVRCCPGAQVAHMLLQLRGWKALEMNILPSSTFSANLA